MRAIILAAGRGSRMKHLTRDSPKCLLGVHGKALLDWQIEALRCAGIEEIAVVTGYKRGALTTRGLVEFHNERWFETNMVESLSMARSWLRGTPCIVTYSDIIYHRSAVQLLMESPSAIAVTYDPNWLNLWQKRFANPLEDAETFRLAPNSDVAEIGGQPKSIAEVEGQYMGLVRLTPEGWEEVNRVRCGLEKKERDNLHMTYILQKVIEAKRVPVKAIPYLGEWGEFDNLTDFSVLPDISLGDS